MRVLVTGAAGFIGSAICLDLASFGHQVVGVDDLSRKGSEKNLEPLRDAGVSLIRGSILEPQIYRALDENFDAIVHAASDPSVHHADASSSWLSARTNLSGTLMMLEWAQERRVPRIVFLSSSRVYSIPELRAIPLLDDSSRFLFKNSEDRTQFVSEEGITEDFPVNGWKSFYGASKLGAEFMIEEWSEKFGGQAIINRFGVVSGSGQSGTEGQGFVQYFCNSILLQRPIRFKGWGGFGHQVRDVLAVSDLTRLIRIQLSAPWDPSFSGPWNVGGGRSNSISVSELAHQIAEKSGRSLEISRVKKTESHDVPWVVMNSFPCQEAFGWAPQVGVLDLVDEILATLEGR